MKGMREIRTRIRAIKSTAQITRAMELVASSKMKKAQEGALRSRMYACELAELLHALTQQVSWDDIQHPFLNVRDVHHRGVLLVMADKGLCGSLNQNLLKEALQLPACTRFIVVGQKGLQVMSRNRSDLLGHFTCPDVIHFKQVQEIVHFLVDAYQSQKIDTVEVLFPRFKNTLVQEPALRRLLPMVNLEEELKNLYHWMGIDGSKLANNDRDFIVEPDGKTILEQLPLLFLKKTLYQILLEAKASEHSARMVAMKSATDNAETLIENLKLEYNKARQASITQEIVEITASQSL
ncbi:MAG: ATP synthase F1 subunit gamma [Puniceicoccales bacterium]|jgi:F-type H+-transporting ATPase subunit gamma|nr:ATP synthase F1 subunit gamma [Puniceicoccales bacterium]